jgi:tetratricopeptide (TPR) repeat protein
MRGTPTLRFLRSVALVALLVASPRAFAADETGPAGDAAGVPMKPESRALYDQGLALYQAKDYAGAITALEAGFALEPRREFLFANAQARRLSGDCRGAVPLYQRFLEMAPPSVQAQATQIALARCAQQMASERVQPIAPPVIVAPPPVPPPPPPPWWHDRAGAALVGAGVVGLGVGTGFLIGALVARGSGEEPAYAGFDTRQARAEGRMTIAVVGLAAGGALVAGGVARYWWVRHRQSATLTIVPGGLALGGSF